jgi:hypothetical protein
MSAYHSQVMGFTPSPPETRKSQLLMQQEINGLNAWNRMR